VAPSTTTRRHEVWESEIEEDRRKVLALKRVQRELGLSLEYEEVLKAEEATGPHWYRGSLSTDTTFAARRRLDRSTLMSQDFAFVLLQYFTKILAACVCFPFTFVTIFVTVLCYYCRPGTLRVM
jgi:hypothetical protein